ncbi:MAG: cellulose binding domain-containing protein [Anaerolineae bacterium]|nr:cellulose binding domain-containing protein [Anaerolineae bacterium]
MRQETFTKQLSNWNGVKLLGLFLVVLVVMGMMRSTAQSQSSGFHINGRHLIDANGNPFVMRGINHAHTWYPGQTSSFANIKATGANTVRVVLSSGHRWTQNSASDVANVIQLCKTNQLICVLEVHDTTGYGEEGAAATLAQAANYWISIQSVLTGEEAYVILNIGNEPWGNNNTSGWLSATTSAIAQLRNAGFAHTIMVDAPNWGQDWQNLMRDNAQQIFSSDPDQNILFDIHMYGVYDTAVEVQTYLETFVNAGLPLVIGEFGHNHSDGNPDEDAIMAWAETYDIGYIGWSWSGNGGGVEYLDMVNNFNPNSLTTWGNRLINGANGITQTSVEASVYGSPVPTSTPGGPTATNTPIPTNTPVPPTATPPPGGPCVVNYAVVNQWNTAYQADVTITNNTGTPITGWTLTFSHAAGQNLIGGWNATLSQVGSVVTASNPASHWNGTIASNGGSVTFGLQATYNGPVVVPTSFMVNGVVCNGGVSPTATPTNPPATGTPTSIPPTATPTTLPPTATPTNAPPTATAVPPTATPGSGGCAVNYTFSSLWGNGFVADVTIANNGSTPINGWALTWTFAGNQAITNLWNGSHSQSGQAVTVNNAPWNHTIPANGSTSVGFQATFSGSNVIPTNFYLNGVLCNP